jgi:hypothetical protein
VVKRRAWIQVSPRSVVGQSGIARLTQFQRKKFNRLISTNSNRLPRFMGANVNYHENKNCPNESRLGGIGLRLDS